MKPLLSLVAIVIVLSAACYAQHCPNPNLQRAEIGGDAINGSVELQSGPLKLVQVRVLSSGKISWSGLTDDNGMFHVKGLRPGTYRLAVKGWGSATIRINPNLTKSFGNGQQPYYWVRLLDNECIGTITVMN